MGHVAQVRIGGVPPVVVVVAMVTAEGSRAVFTECPQRQQQPSSLSRSSSSSLEFWRLEAALMNRLKGIRGKTGVVAEDNLS